jgi:hypothetical protein
VELGFIEGSGPAIENGDAAQDLLLFGELEIELPHPRTRVGLLVTRDELLVPPAVIQLGDVFRAHPKCHTIRLEHDRRTRGDFALRLPFPWSGALLRIAARLAGGYRFLRADRAVRSENPGLRKNQANDHDHR